MGSMVVSERQQTLEIAPEICLKKREFFPDDSGFRLQAEGLRPAMIFRLKAEAT
jgi:hypothetical protein